MIDHPHDPEFAPKSLNPLGGQAEVVANCGKDWVDGIAFGVGEVIAVLADVIDSIIVKPTFQTLTVLGFLVVVVRTIVSWTLTLEVEGHWPWQIAGEKKPEAENA